MGRAYDMAREIAPLLTSTRNILDVGCGNGYIAHHLKALLDCRITGIDVIPASAASIRYLPYDGRHFPVMDESVDAILLCYVLHHAQDLNLVISEMRRVLRIGGTIVVYEDTPRLKWDRAVCWLHNLQWKSRTGKCSFHREDEWQTIFTKSGFNVVQQKTLSRWRNLAHPVSRTFFVLKNCETSHSTVLVRRNTELAVLERVYGVR
jgi:ubiquinone/menaquinone biosynthesis C-methylase UbiE